MPRIRKKTSNRQNTRDRAKIKKHVAEHKKKSRKASKKDVTWKSKKKADPGVPNSFIHKDKVLAEMAAEKRAAEEAKLARREAAKAPAQNGTPEPEDDTPGIQSILSATVSSRSRPVIELNGDDEEGEDEEEAEVPELVDTSLTTLQEALDKADVVVEVVDARDIAGGRSKFVEDLVKEAGGRVVLLVNKIDRVPREALQAWVDRTPLPVFLFKSRLPAAPSTSQGIDHTSVLGRTELLDFISSVAPADKETGDVSVALLGLPNVGKTSVLNSLLPAKAKHYEVAPVTALAAASKNPQPTTKMPSESRIEYNGKGIRVIDTPGWDYADDEDDEEEEEDEDVDEEDVGEVSEEKMKKLDEIAERMTGDLLRRNLGRVDRVKDIVTLADYIITRCNAQDLMLAYNVPFFPDGDTLAFLTSVARSTGRLRKGGQPDIESSARFVVRDWAQNTFPYYSTTPKSTSGSMDVEKAEQPDMSSVLDRCTPRKEMRKLGKGVIRFKSGAVDEREVILDDDFTAALAPSDNEDDEEEEEEDEDDEEEGVEGEELEGDIDSDEEIVEGADFEVDSASDDEEVADDDEDEEEEDEEEEASPEPSPPRKLKRKTAPEHTVSPGGGNKKKARTASISAGANKRVSFGGKLGATGSNGSLGSGESAREVKGILKRDRNGDFKAPAPAPASAPKTKTKSNTKVAAAPTTVVANGTASATAPPAKLTSKKANGKKAVEGAYDFSAHFA